MLVAGLLVGWLGFALLGYVLVGVAERRSFREQPPSKKKIIVCLALAQWPYMFLGASSAFVLLVRLSQG